MASNTDTSLDEKVKEYKANGDPPEARGYTSSESGASDVWDVDSDHPNFGYQESGASFWDVKEGKEDLNVTVSTWDDEQEAVKSVQPEKKELTTRTKQTKHRESTRTSDSFVSMHLLKANVFVFLWIKPHILVVSLAISSDSLRLDVQFEHLVPDWFNLLHMVGRYRSPMGETGCRSRNSRLGVGGRRRLYLV